MSRTKVFIEDSFDAAHSLPHLPDGHKCRNLHGHTYRIRIEISGVVDISNAWIMDYADLKDIWLPIKAKLDHCNLDQVVSISTCESVAQFIFVSLSKGLPKSVSLTKVELRETERCGAVIE